MTMLPRQIPLSAKPIRVAIAGPEPTLVVNRGSVAVWLATTDGLSTSSDQVAILDPGGTIRLTGSSDWWGITADGSSNGLVNSIPGAEAETWTAQSVGNAIAGVLPPAAWSPTDLGLLTANYDLPAATSSPLLTAGTLYLAKLPIRAALTLATLWFGVGGAASGAQNVQAGVYSQAGTLLSGSGNVGAQFVTQNYAQCTLTTPQQLAAWVWVAILSNMGGSQAQPSASATSTRPAFNLAGAAAALQFATNGTLLANLPATINPASNVVTNSLPIWVGGS